MENLSDHKHLASEISELFFEEWKFTRDIQKNIDKFKVLVLDGQFVGCYSMDGNVFNATLSDVYVVPHLRNKGIGAFMLKHASRNIYFVMSLLCERKAEGFYKKQGFFTITTFRDEKRLMVKLNCLVVFLVVCVFFFIL